MLLKSADGKSKRLALLEDLQGSSVLDTSQRKWLRDELVRLKRGIQGERESAHYLDHYFRDGENNVVIHDLRFVVDGEVTQIDHLILNRTSNIFLLETKNYACNLVINEHGEFTAEYDNARFGIPSPIEQSIRHERVLAKLLEKMDIVGRTQKQPDFHHLVMFHPKATIERPPSKVFDTSNVIKADQFPSWHKRFVEKSSVGDVFKFALNMRNLDTIKGWGEKLLRQHRPADLLTLPDFMRPRPLNKASDALIQQTAPPAAASSHSSPLAPHPASPVSPSSPQPAEVVKRLICAHCGSKIPYDVGKFCWNNDKRFGGSAYCREHQSLF